MESLVNSQLKNVLIKKNILCGVQTQGFKLNGEHGGYYCVECLAIVNEQHSYIGIPLVQMG